MVKDSDDCGYLGLYFIITPIKAIAKRVARLSSFCYLFYLRIYPQRATRGYQVLSPVLMFKRQQIPLTDTGASFLWHRQSFTSSNTKPTLITCIAIPKSMSEIVAILGLQPITSVIWYCSDISDSNFAKSHAICLAGILLTTHPQIGCGRYYFVAILGLQPITTVHWYCSVISDGQLSTLQQQSAFSRVDYRTPNVPFSVSTGC